MYLGMAGSTRKCMSLSSAIFQHGRQQHSRTSHRPKQIICSWMSETGSRSALPVSCRVLTGIDLNTQISSMMTSCTAMAHCMQPYNVLLKMCQFSGDKALQSTRKHTACTNGVRTKDWTTEFSMIPRKKGLFFCL
jgi:hypothetical protein